MAAQLNQALEQTNNSQLERSSGQPSEIREIIGGKKKATSLSLSGIRYWLELRSLYKAGKNGQALPQNMQHVHIRKGLAAYIHGALRASRFLDGVLDLKTLDKLIFNHYIDILNRSNWSTTHLRNTLSFQASTAQHKTAEFLSTMTPASQLSGGLKRAYEASGIQGVCSYSTQEARHAVNLWQTQFNAENRQQTGQPPLFSGIRHGVHDAYGLNGAERIRANQQRTWEFVKACLVDQMARRPLNERQLAGLEVIELPIVSVNLLTPVGKEKSMIEHQTAAFNAMELMHNQSLHNKAPLILRITDPQGHPRKVQVAPRFLPFNVPVNGFALGLGAHMTGIWRFSDGMNQAAITALIGHPDKAFSGLAGARLAEYAQQLSDLKSTEREGGDTTAQQRVVHQKMAMITTLSEQIRSITRNHRHHSVGKEPYKLPVRLLALAHECGAVPAYNCKSGKDRTGQLNVEIRDFYAHFHGTGQFRQPDAQRSELERQNYSTLFADGGDRHIQTLNTGVPGSKSQLPFYHALLGVKAEKMDAIKGLSKWVGT
ncbi:hypothetical protein NQT62_07335 [Limnobacter humi]|uniref:Uncharacterized protein n=1 Tax=Limnobacter humi TaxID=1778671 RepID=A0ABT1WFE5_9BURK|nr:inositol phosphate phosphatase SopB [Limnobacter humi]MCQ8896246.1 hypothetical protein [Limnobacter humi]